MLFFFSKKNNTHQYNTDQICIICFFMSIPYPYKKELGEGSYGVTYLIDYNGQEAVLKWPHNRNTLFRKEVLYTVFHISY